MKSPFHPYFELCFRTAFTKFEPAWIDLAVASIEEERELIASDFELKKPSVAAADFSSQLAATMEVDTTVFGALLYRIESGIFRRTPLHPALPYLAQIMKLRTGMEIYYSAVIGPRFRIMHGTGLVLGPRHRIGSDFTVYQGVTLGQRQPSSPQEFITVGDHCTIFTGAKMLGTICMGDDVRLAANAVLLADADAHSTYAGIPARKVKDR